MSAYFEYPHTVSEQEIDDLNHAGNFHFVKWMQHAAIAHSSDNGWPPQRHIELRAGWVARSHTITYLKPAFEGDSLIIKTWVANMKSAISLRRYEIFNEAGEMLAKAETLWAFVNYERQKPTRIPAEVATSFEVVPD